MKSLLIRLIVGIVIFISVLGSCKKPQADSGKMPIARVYDEFLYLDDIQDVYTEGFTQQDSIEKMREFINKWAKAQLLKRKAELNLSDDQLDVTRQLEDYRATLLIHKYKCKFIHQNLDTVVTDSEVAEYYERHKDDFILLKPAVKALYIKIDKTAPNLESLKRKYYSLKEKDTTYVREYCLMHASKFDNFNNDWVYFSDLIAEIPVSIDNVQEYLQTKTTIETTNEEFQYLVKIYDFKLSGDISPQIFILNSIRKIILNIKQEKLITNLENDLFNDALSHDNLEYLEINKD